MTFDEWMLTVVPAHKASDDTVTLRVLRQCWIAAQGDERERCAQYLRNAADRLTPEGKRTNQVDRHVAHVLACKGDEIACGAHLGA